MSILASSADRHDTDWHVVIRRIHEFADLGLRSRFCVRTRFRLRREFFAQFCLKPTPLPQFYVIVIGDLNRLHARGEPTVGGIVRALLAVSGEGGRSRRIERAWQ